MEINVENAFARAEGLQIEIGDVLDDFARHEMAHNGLIVTIDYLEFTLFATPDPVADIAGREFEAIEEVLMIDSGHFAEIPKGMNGYPKRLKWAPASLFVLYGAGPRQGVHITMSGNACRAYASQVGDLLMLMLRIVSVRGKVTRLDLAVDDLVTQYYSIAELLECYKRHEIISRWKYMEQQFKSHIESQVNIKECLYFGSMKSDCFLRVYNKTIEQMNREQKKIEAIASVEETWTRWELVLRRDAAMSVVNLVMNRLPLGEIWCGIMANYFKIVQSAADTNRSRWALQEKWVRFVGDALPLSIKMYPETRDLSTLKRWLSQQIMPSLAAVMEADHSLEWIAQNILSSVDRINPYYQALISAERNK